MRDTDIRLALHNYLGARHRDEASTLIRDELGICAGARRVDVAVVNGELAGYEIKSDDDSLTRLAGQVEAYGRVVDRATVVTTARHLDKAREVVPAWWGVMLAKPVNGRVDLIRVRSAKRNPARDAYAIAQLMWREEALDALRHRGLGRGLSKLARHYVWSALAEAVAMDELCALARDQLKARQVKNAPAVCSVSIGDVARVPPAIKRGAYQ